MKNSIKALGDASRKVDQIIRLRREMADYWTVETWGHMPDRRLIPASKHDDTPPAYYFDSIRGETR